MHAQRLAVAAVLAALAAPAAADATTVTITASGTGRVKVVPANRDSNASIAAAEAAAQRASVPLALTAAQARAGEYAAADGLTLGPLLSISDQLPNGPFFGPGQVEPGPFGPGRFCGTIRVPIGRPMPVVRVVGGTKVVLPPRRVRLKKVHRCFVPSPATTTLIVAYSAS
jgi:uncharacterized protein YggE